MEQTPVATRPIKPSCRVKVGLVIRIKDMSLENLINFNQNKVKVFRKRRINLFFEKWEAYPKL
jgi:hypothetical protein